MALNIKRCVQLSVFCTFILLVFYSCKKEERDFSVRSEEQIQGVFNSWLKTQTDTTNLKIANWLKMLESSVLLKDAYVEPDGDDDATYTIIPLSREFSSFFNPDKSRKPFLILISRKNRVLANIALVRTSAQSLPRDLFTTMFTSRISSIDAEVIFLKSYDRYNYATSYKNGVPFSFTRMTTNSDSPVQVEADCVEWYYRTYYYNSDGTLDHYVDETVAIICDACSPDDPLCVDTGDGSNPEGGGSGGSGSGGTEEEQEAAFISSMLSTSSQEGTKDITFTSPVEAKKQFQWRVVGNTYSLWEVFSTDEAVGYSGIGTGSIMYRIDHISSKIWGQTAFSTKKNGIDFPLIMLSWSESGHYSTIATDYKSGSITVSGQLKNFLITIGNYMEKCTVTINQ